MRHCLRIWHSIICRRGFRGTGQGSTNRGCGGEAPHALSNNVLYLGVGEAPHAPFNRSQLIGGCVGEAPHDYPRTPPCVSPSINRRCSARKITRIGAIIITAAALVSPQSREKRVVNW